MKKTVSVGGYPITVERFREGGPPFVYVIHGVQPGYGRWWATESEACRVAVYNGNPYFVSEVPVSALSDVEQDQLKMDKVVPVQG